MVAGHLREQNGYYQMVLNWKGKNGKRKSKSISTRLTVEGNKAKAEQMLYWIPVSILTPEMSLRTLICCLLISLTSGCKTGHHLFHQRSMLGMLIP